MLGIITVLPCPCVKLLGGRDEKKCIGLGPYMLDTLTRFPDYQSFDVLTTREAESMVTRWDEQGMTHSVWTFRTPYIAAMCNCTEQCMAYKFAIEDNTIDMLRKSDYVSYIDQEKCDGCTMCADYCRFGAIDINRRWIDPDLCYGCGVCRQVCPVGAISMRERAPTLPTVEARDD
jgi:ferredoxin